MRAIQACGLALGRQPGHFWARYLQAICYLEIKRWAQAEAGLTACLGQRSDFFWAQLLRGTAHAELGFLHSERKEPEAADVEFKAAKEDFQQALEKAGDPLSRYVVLTNRSVLWARQERWDDAEADLKKAIALRPGDHLAHVNRAAVRRQRNDLQGAVEAMDRAVECRPDDGLLYYTRARDHLARKDAAKARRDLEQAIAQMREGRDGDRLASAWVELGVLKHRAGQLPEALADFDAALAVQPHYPPAHRQQAQTLAKLKKYREAGQALDLYLKNGPPAADVYLARGMIHSQFREYASAVEAYSRTLMLKADPRTFTHADALTRRGWAYLQLEAHALALADFEEALKRRPAHASSLCGRGNARILLGQVSEAVRDGEAALRLEGATQQELQVACIFSRAAGLLSLTKQGREWLQSRYEERAADLVCQALRRMPEKERAAYWRSHIQTEAALASVRRHPKVVRLAPGLRE